MDSTQISSMSWFAEMAGMENSMSMEQWNFMDSYDEEMAAMLGRHTDFDDCLSFSAANNSPPPPPSSTFINVIPHNSSFNSLSELHLQDPNDSSFSILPNTDPRPNSTPVILNFGNAAASQIPHQQVLNPDEEAAVSEVLRSRGAAVEDQEKPLQPPAPKKPSRVRPPSQTYDHILAERKRREQLSQRFITLSTIVPGLKKMDKTSVLGDAIKYLKHLQEKVKTLEEQSTRQTMESVILVKQQSHHVNTADKEEDDDDDDGSDEKRGCRNEEQPVPQIEAKLCKNHVLVRVHCPNRRGILVMLLGKVESLNLTVINTNVSPFGIRGLLVTIVAEMERDFNLNAKEVVKRLRAAF